MIAGDSQTWTSVGLIRAAQELSAPTFLVATSALVRPVSSEIPYCRPAYSAR